MGGNSGNNGQVTGKDNRELSKAELRRKENFGKIKEELISKGYRRVDLTISIAKANTVGILITLPIIAVVAAAFILYNRGLNMESILNAPWPDYMNIVIFLVSFIAFVFIHEGIHGLCWSFGTPGHFKDIEFGFIVQLLTPYCTCKVPLSIPVYIFGSLMPMTLLGIIPGIICIFFGNPFFLGIFAIQILAGAGDFLITCLVIRHMSKTKSKDVVLIDHPYECGAVIFEK